MNRGEAKMNEKKITRESWGKKLRGQFMPEFSSSFLSAPPPPIPPPVSCKL
jgi:hypothetical protein